MEPFQKGPWAFITLSALSLLVGLMSAISHWWDKAFKAPFIVQLGGIRSSSAFNAPKRLFCHILTS